MAILTVSTITKFVTGTNFLGRWEIASVQYQLTGFNNDGEPLRSSYFVSAGPSGTTYDLTPYHPALLELFETTFAITQNAGNLYASINQVTGSAGEFTTILPDGSVQVRPWGSHYFWVNNQGEDGHQMQISGGWQILYTLDNEDGEVVILHAELPNEVEIPELGSIRQYELRRVQ